MKKRVVWVDILKYISIMFVMFCHTDFNNQIMEKFYTNFFLYAFFFASGYVYKHKVGFKEFIVKKMKGILVPWFFFGAYNIFVSQILTNSEGISFTEAIKCFFLQVRGYNDKMWFLSALFISFIPFYFMINCYWNAKNSSTAKKYLILVSLGLSFVSRIYSRYMDPDLLPWKRVGLPWHIEYIFVAVFWMVLGYLFKECWETYFDEKVSDLVKLFSIPLAILLIYLPVFNSIENRIIIIFLCYVTEILCIIGCITISKKVTANKYFLYVGQNTLIYLGIHGKVMSVCQKIMQVVIKDLYTSIISNYFLSTVIGFIFVFVLSVVLMVPTYIINRWLPFMVGKSMKKS